MNVRLKCSCGARFTTGDDLRGRMVRCPKCRKTLRVPEGVPAGGDPRAVTFQTEDEPEPVVAEPPSRWQPHNAESSNRPRQRSGAWKWLLLVLVLLVPIGAVGVLVAIPYFTPKDPREIVAQRYLDAVRRGDLAEAGRLSVIVTDHPRNITRVDRIGAPALDPRPVRGKFLPLRQFHSEITQRYTYNETRGRFEPKDPLGFALEALSKVEGIQRKADEQSAAREGSTKKYANPEEKVLDDVIGRYSAFGELAKGAGSMLSSENLGPTYEDLLKQSTITMTDSERALAESFAKDPAKWKRLLGDRSFLDLPDLGEFELYDVQLVASIRTEGQSLGEPGRTIRLRLVRFVMGSIDTGWRVWQAE
jgi:hypothetical protein